MHVITAPTDPVTTPGATMTTLASPSLGSAELSTWRVEMAPNASGPEHTIDREQVWMLTRGTLEITAEGATHTARAGQTVVLPAGVARQVNCPSDEPAEALVAMAADGRAAISGDATSRPVPWAR
ncbi:cupin domain-containing protein [Streptomyces sp. 3MP-14]|uniref:Cupin domain-containing protein n=1 Tax=Streptomyces mimosae TaxID=2586635 RepID=A0A5N5ZST1_9ACTN|nr:MULTISPECIES: cupin domain-containing protein [Streptomyces]KAB8158380.1 cupin domain-containing protein [Streptomyces mimosae]KAB8172573.1 cupin domain-containing protein [Streptomyces sp. 3MP-14]